MGRTVVGARLYSSRDSPKHLELGLLVGAGSAYTWVKRDKLRKLDVKLMTKKFKTVGGKIMGRG
jgi:hypothetical protein